MEPGTKYSLHRHDNNRVNSVRAHVELPRLHSREARQQREQHCQGEHRVSETCVRLHKRERHDNCGFDSVRGTAQKNSNDNGESNRVRRTAKERESRQLWD